MPRSGSRIADPRKRRAERGGRRAETLAALYLLAKGYGTLAQRAKTPVGEIDLIVRRGRTIVFVEVKRRGRAAGEAEALAAVDAARIVRAAQWCLARNPGWHGCDMRFDVIFLAPRRWPRHLINAFPASDAPGG